MLYLFNDNIVPNAQHDLLKQLFFCKNFEKSDRLLGASKGRGTTWFLNTRAELGVNIILRHYYRGGLFGKFVKDCYLFTQLNQTRAFREFELLQKMHAWGLPVPRPVAIQVENQLFCYRADIMIEKVENTHDLSKFLQKHTLNATQYQALGALIRQLHNHQIHHSDLNIHNILLDDTGKFWLIDFDKCSIEQGNTWKQANLDRLLRSFRKEQGRLGIQFNKQDWVNVLEGYKK